MHRLKVSSSCPSCGAPFEFLEGANVARCRFCNLPILFRSQKKILRYYLQPKLKKRETRFLIDRFRKVNGQSLSKRIDDIRLFYLPFWRFTAQAFYTIISHTFFDPASESSDEEILTKDWDISFSAHTVNSLGIATLGMRSNWLKLQLLTGKNLIEDGQVLNLDLDSNAAKERAIKSLRLYTDKKKSYEDELVLRLLEERLSLIYFPLWVVNFIAPEGKFFQVIDGITKRTLKQGPGYFELKKEKQEDVEKLYPLKIVPHRCPNCGWDLPINPFHVVFPCNNCRRIWKISENGYQQVKAEKAKTKQEQMITPSRSYGYYPFWVFETRLKENKILSIQDLIKILPSEIGLFKVKDKSQSFLFYIPAFRIRNLKKIPDISYAFTRTQPKLEAETEVKGKLNGVFITEDDAKELAEILWINLISSKINLDLKIWKNLQFENAKIVWLPFYQDGIFLRDAIIEYGFQKVR
jgi:DNA-directed RNA polymerase subunit RPC12/RpoP